VLLLVGVILGLSNGTLLILDLADVAVLAVMVARPRVSERPLEHRYAVVSGEPARIPEG
jgi:hypothetical protein